jgi:hypothetical protein
MKFDYVTFEVPGDLSVEERRAFAIGLALDLFGKRSEVEVVSVHGHEVRVRRQVRRTNREDRRLAAYC